MTLQPHSPCRKRNSASCTSPELSTSTTGDDGAVGNRDARYVCGVFGIWKPGEPEADTFLQWVRDAWQRIQPFSTGGNYINFQTADEGEERIRTTYGANFDRLVEAKMKYDPDNMFRSNRNIAPRNGTGSA